MQRAKRGKSVADAHNMLGSYRQRICSCKKSKVEYICSMNQRLERKERELKQTKHVGWAVFADPVDSVEVMNTHTKQWNTVPRLPRRCSELSAAICGNTLYLAGGITASSSLKGLNSPFKSVFTCSLPELLTSNTRGSRLRQPPRDNV